MRIHLLAVGTRLPAWVNQGYEEYAKRLPPECRLELTEISAARRTKNTSRSRLVAEEGKRLLDAIPAGAHTVALDEGGKALTTVGLAQTLEQWLGGGRDCALLVGGADGLAADCLNRAERRWSLSPLTLPHGLVRVVVAEQLYRAWSLLRGHPYHRA